MDNADIGKRFRVVGHMFQNLFETVKGLVKCPAPIQGIAFVSQGGGVFRILAQRLVKGRQGFVELSFFFIDVAQIWIGGWKARLNPNRLFVKFFSIIQSTGMEIYLAENVHGIGIVRVFLQNT